MVEKHATGTGGALVDGGDVLCHFHLHSSQIIIWLYFSCKLTSKHFVIHINQRDSFLENIYY
jgi:hypothetical protein